MTTKTENSGFDFIGANLMSLVSQLKSKNFDGVFISFVQKSGCNVPSGKRHVMSRHDMCWLVL